MSEQEMLDYFERRHAQEMEEDDDLEDEYAEPADLTAEQSELLPTPQDPTLWFLRVRLGEEKSLVLRLLRKCIAKANADEVS
jgi:hypothetical protein